MVQLLLKHKRILAGIVIILIVPVAIFFAITSSADSLTITVTQVTAGTTTVQYQQNYTDQATITGVKSLIESVKIVPDGAELSCPIDGDYRLTYEFQFTHWGMTILRNTAQPSGCGFINDYPFLAIVNSSRCCTREPFWNRLNQLSQAPIPTLGKPIFALNIAMRDHIPA